MAPIRNSCVARGVISTTGYFNVYTVPAGYVLLLKNVLLENDQATSATGWIRVSSTTPSVTLVVWSGSLVSGTCQNWSGWTALNAGDSVSIGASPAPLTYWVSGALLPFNPGY